MNEEALQNISDSLVKIWLSLWKPI